MSGLDFGILNLGAFLAHLEWLSPWALLGLPLPLLLRRLPPYRQRRPALYIAFFDLAVRGAGRVPEPGAVVVPAGITQMIVLALAWCLLLLALARPVYLEPPLTRIQPARDLLLAVDISPSMRARDYRDREGRPAERMAAVKDVLDEFIARRGGDRIGLLFFGQEPYVQAPFTLEHGTVRELLAQARPGMAGGRTLIGDALGLSIRMFEASTVPSKVVVLLSDGADTGSRVPPLKAAGFAARAGITVHTVAIGDPRAVGEDRVDVNALIDIAQATGGRAYRAEDRVGLAAIYRQLDALEQQNFKTLSWRPQRPLYPWPLGAALVLLLGWHAVAALAAALRFMPWAEQPRGTQIKSVRTELVEVHAAPPLGFDKLSPNGWALVQRFPGQQPEQDA
ncbi:VWA domain-containing protein [Denitratisoma oestradiolicum]|uniref:VWFA domain-containing protein n=1 Tax=Denitratisoma oestradiolicum TaxID=311182 RepID=A0A6S6XVV0_9PROT|nr:VWA domain-containing protein [Denitratisoma oestradiolicum]CAB1370174.1 conserved membrane protein of unknown function [Denitratisoma oestradiolicum]